MATEEENKKKDIKAIPTSLQDVLDWARSQKSYYETCGGSHYDDYYDGKDAGKEEMCEEMIKYIEGKGI